VACGLRFEQHVNALVTAPGLARSSANRTLAIVDQRENGSTSRIRDVGEHQVRARSKN
jgi:hypothetical protein